MATLNPFDILGDNDTDDPSVLIAAQQQKVVAKKPAAAAAAAVASQASAKLPSKPLPPAQAVREARESRSNIAPARGGAGRGGPGRGRGGRGGFAPNRDFENGNVEGFPRRGPAGAVGGEEGNAGRFEDRERPQRQPFVGGRRGGYGGRGGYGNGEGGDDAERPQRRMYERRSGTGRGYEMKRDGSGRGNWGSAAEEALAQEKESLNADDKTVGIEKQADQEDLPPTEADKDNKEPASNEEEKEEDKEMTLEEYEKIREEKRKALLALKAEERKVEIDKDLQSMQQLSAKKESDPVFVKLGSDKESDKKKQADRDEKGKKAVPITEFLKPAEGERYYNRGGRGRGRGRGDRGSMRGGYGNSGSSYEAPAPAIGDSQEFPTLGAKSAK